MDSVSEIDNVDQEMKFSARDLFENTAESPGVSENNEVRFLKTALVMERLRGNPFFEEATPENRYGMWQGRRIIGRDTLINKGVYLGGGPREAIVVDDEKQPELERLYRDLIQNIKNKGGDFKKYAIREVYNTVDKTLKYNKQKVEEIHKKTGGTPDQKIALSMYIKNGVGVCRHQSILCAYLLERLVIDKHLNGKVSVDRNEIRGLGGHAWARYTNSAGEVFILDVAQHYIGPLDDMSHDQFRWFYERPSDSAKRSH